MRDDGAYTREGTYTVVADSLLGRDISEEMLVDSEAMLLGIVPTLVLPSLVFDELRILHGRSF